MECTVHWMPTTGMGFVAETGSGHLLTMDGAPDGGGRNLAARPMETLLAGAGLSFGTVSDQSFVLNGQVAGIAFVAAGRSHFREQL